MDPQTQAEYVMALEAHRSSLAMNARDAQRQAFIDQSAMLNLAALLGSPMDATPDWNTSDYVSEAYECAERLWNERKTRLDSPK